MTSSLTLVGAMGNEDLILEFMDFFNGGDRFADSGEAAEVRRRFAGTRLSEVYLFCTRKMEDAFASLCQQARREYPEVMLRSVDLPFDDIASRADEEKVKSYQLVVCSDRFFVYQRGGGVGEQRLSGRCSLGIGGHINHEDADASSLSRAAYQEALLRERHEELLCPADIEDRFIGWINDDSDPVGQVHLGAVHLCRVTSEADILIRSGEEDIHAKGWLRADEIHGSGERFEKWSLLALDLALSSPVLLVD